MAVTVAAASGGRILGHRQVARGLARAAQAQTLEHKQRLVAWEVPAVFRETLRSPAGGAEEAVP